MYKRILVTLDGTATDRAIIEHIKLLATRLGSRLVLLHVATGMAAQYHRSDAAGKEIEDARRYLHSVQEELVAAGVPTETELAFGDPAREIVNWVKKQGCDLVAMSTHGHQFVADIVLGTTANRVQHSISVPVLLLRAR